jgi:4-aminobutyrate aminotransferase-like enzyme/Ser/Thr protein kinase RdoA (MazF antagonist)
LLDQSPSFTLDDAERLARDHFGVAGRAIALTSERDQNFLIEPARGDGVVLKIANAAENPAMLDAQRAVIEHLSGASTLTPRFVTGHHADERATATRDGKTHAVWAISVLPGRPLADLRDRSAELHADIGRQVAALTGALEKFDHTAIHRDFYWDLSKARGIVESRAHAIDNDEVSGAIRRLAHEFDTRVKPLLGKLPRAAIHGDLNDTNILVSASNGQSALDHRVSGIVDFGDMVYSYRVGDLAIAIAYAMLGSDDPLTIVAQIARGYAERATLNDDEMASLFGLAVLRLCASACIAADQQRERPGNAYLGVSQNAIRKLLPILARTPFPLAGAVVRDAFGVDPVPASSRVAAYLRRVKPYPVMGIDLSTEPSIVLDLSIASPILSGNPDDNTEPALTKNVFDMMDAAGVKVSVGRYDEPRLLYTTPLFALGPRAIDDHRTIHIGLDLFMPPGTPVYAPLDGVMHACHDNRSPLDYGPMMILRHTTDDGLEFFTLYGHLSRESLNGQYAGRVIKAGQQIATLGTPEVNVGWTPHLHLQVITDLLGLGTDFPGVGRPSQRRVWTALCPDPNLLARIPAERFPAETPPKSETLAKRRGHIGGNLSIAYRDPVRIVRGWMEYLYDDEGRCFVDAYNNVPHVGHCHPRVVEAVSRQMRILNTNTRYLNDLLIEYADRLLATLPPSLEVCYFVNSASEANELALRLARAATGQRDTIVLEAAYHGNTTSLIDISPYKHAGPGGDGAPDWVHVAPLPDVYRGAHKRDDPEAGAKYAAHVGTLIETMAKRGKRPAAFIAETCPSVGGQLVLPPGYLANVYEFVRAAGGLCIADEVQTGLGRMGTSFWAFEGQGVVPDMVVMGKPLGNGHPIGAVATTRAIAAAFDNWMVFFCTFGGNTVSCAAGIAVLDVLRDERLQEHARTVGERLLSKLRPLVDRHPIVGDVRGSGLFLGVELVRDRTTLEPAGAEASFVANRLRERGILLGTDGTHHNVVKIRPPMPFTLGDADILADELERAVAMLSHSERPAFRRR